MTVNANQCFFNTYNDSCQRIITSYNDFQLTDLSTNNEFKEYVVEVYNKNNPSNKLQFTKNNFNLKQLSPFLEPGVYTIEVKAYNKADNFLEKKFDYIFDNTELMPPIIPVEIISTTNTITVSGKTTPNTNVVAEYNGITRTVTSNTQGKFDLTLNSLAKGINYVKFYTTKDTKKSQIVERIIYTEKLEPKYDTNIASISINNLELLNENTLDGYTTKRNFFVSGKITSFTSTAGQVVFVNGQKTLVDSNGNFAAFVLLNEGENDITATSGGLRDTYLIDFVRFYFQIHSLEYEKIVAGSSVNFNGKTTFDYPFLVFVNGNYLSKIEPTNKNFDFTIGSLKEGKNFIEFIGLNGFRYSTIIYQDTKKPTVEALHNSKIASPDKLTFRISDDIGVNMNSVKLILGGVELGKEDLLIKDSFYLFDISDKSNGNYAYTISGKDIVGREFSQSGNFEINSAFTAIEKFELKGNVYGNRIFIGSEKQEIIITPSKNIAFKSIYLDGIEQVNYNILRNGNIRLNLDIQNINGTIDFTFIDSSYQTFTQKYNYISDKETPVLKLDYINYPATTNKVKISGEIIDSNFDWSSVSLNSQNSYMRYGKYFEALIDLNNDGSNNLVISGNDYAKNSFTQSFGGILYNDKRITQVSKSNLIQTANLSYSGSLYFDNEANGIWNYVSNYDGFKFSSLYLSADNFELPISQRFGLKSLKLNGFESSGQLFSSDELYFIESKTNYSHLNIELEPRIHYEGVDNPTTSTSTVIIGYVETFDQAIEVSSDGNPCQVIGNSFACPVDLEDGINIVPITVTDSNGNTDEIEVEIELLTDNLVVTIESLSGSGVYKFGSDYYLFNNMLNIDGKINNPAIITALIDGREIKLNEKNGTFVIPVDMSITTDSTEEKLINIQLKAEDSAGHTSFSNIVKIIYNRIYETFASVSVR